MIYKYCKVDDYSIMNLERNMLFCQNHIAFNDPFECWFKLEKDIPDPQVEKDRYYEICKEWGFTPDDNDLEDYNLYMDELKDYQPNIPDYIKKARIACFSKEIDNLLMWSHYADGLRGFCIGFDEKELIKNVKEQFASIVPVNYTKIPPVVDTMLYALANDQIWYHELAIEEDISRIYTKEYKAALKQAKKLLDSLYTKTIATKPAEWKYEKEVRLIIDTDYEDCRGEFFYYPTTAIKSLTIGEKMTQENIEKLFDIVNNKRVPILKFIAQRKTDTYNIDLKKVMYNDSASN